MPTIKVRQGDCIASIAERFGLLPESVWDDPANAKLKALRKDPNVLMPGDEVVVHSKEMKEVSISTGSRHEFRIKGVQERLVIQFNLDNEPRANEDYVLELDGMLFDGQTNESGMIQVVIPPNAKKGNILFRDSGDEYELKLGNLDPITEISGVQGRLENLGFFNGPVDGKKSEELEQAISDFQKKKDLKPTGALDDTTLKMIKQAYGR